MYRPAHDLDRHEFLLYLMQKLCRAQRFSKYIGKPWHWATNSDPLAIIADHRKRHVSEPGTKFPLTVSRYYGSHPQEQHNNITVTFHTEVRDKVRLASGHTCVEVTRNYPKDTITIPITSGVGFKETWMRILEAIDHYRSQAQAKRGRCEQAMGRT